MWQDIVYRKLTVFFPWKRRRWSFLLWVSCWKMTIRTSSSCVGSMHLESDHHLLSRKLSPYFFGLVGSSIFFEGNWLSDCLRGWKIIAFSGCITVLGKSLGFFLRQKALRFSVFSGTKIFFLYKPANKNPKNGCHIQRASFVKHLWSEFSWSTLFLLAWASESFDSVDLGPGKLRESFWLKWDLR